MKRIWLLLLCLFVLVQLGAQNLIGKRKAEIGKLMKVMYPDFALDNSIINKTYNYLKYEDKFNEQTMLIFLSDKDECTATKLMSSYSNLLQVKKELGQKYKTAGKDRWQYTENGIKYLVKLKREEWYFSVFTSKEK